MCSTATKRSSPAGANNRTAPTQNKAQYPFAPLRLTSFAPRLSPFTPRFAVFAPRLSPFSPRFTSLALRLASFTKPIGKDFAAPHDKGPVKHRFHRAFVFLLPLDKIRAATFRSPTLLLRGSVRVIRPHCLPPTRTQRADFIPLKQPAQELFSSCAGRWAKMDSNHRRRKPADLQSAPFGHSGICPFVRLRWQS